jgi:thiol:disulfide interchange protein
MTIAELLVRDGYWPTTEGPKGAGTKRFPVLTVYADTTVKGQWQLCTATAWCYVPEKDDVMTGYGPKGTVIAEPRLYDRGE